jgi:TetR/AcrR family transcriptional repressor of mexJK operon
MTDRFGHLALYLFYATIQPVMTISDLTDHEGLSPERRARILNGACEVFMREGYEGASMSQIAMQAQVSKGTLYNYFPSKSALFAVFVRDACENFLQDVFGTPAPDAPLAGELHRIGRKMVKMLLGPRARAVFRVVVMEAAKFPDLAMTFVESGPILMVNRLAAWLSMQNEAGRLVTPDPQFAAEQFFALTQTQLVMRARINPDYHPSEEEVEQVVNGAVDVFLAAYAMRHA